MNNTYDVDVYAFVESTKEGILVFNFTVDATTYSAALADSRKMVVHQLRLLAPFFCVVNLKPF